MSEQKHLFEEVLKGRCSVRGFLPTPVPMDTLRKIFESAQQSPSNCNTQPWSVYVVSGKQRKLLGEKLYGLASEESIPNPDYQIQNTYEAEFRQRQVGCAFALYENMNVKRDDKEARKAAMLRNFQFFGAPHAAFITMPKNFGVFNGLDVGMYLQTLLLCMKSYGVSSCAQGALALYPDAVREAIGIPDAQGILVGVSFGYEDTTHITSNTVTSRAKLEEVVTFFGE